MDSVSTDNEHEGWAACAAPDGRLSASSSVEGMLFEGITGRYKRDQMMPDYEVVPDNGDRGLAGTVRVRLATPDVGTRHFARRCRL